MSRRLFRASAKLDTLKHDRFAGSKGKLILGAGPCPLWVISGHFAMRGQCPLYPRKGHRATPIQCPLCARSGLLVNVECRLQVLRVSKNSNAHLCDRGRRRLACAGLALRGQVVNHWASLRRRKRRAILGAPGQLPQGHRRVWVARLCAQPASAPRGKRGGS